MQEEKIGGKGGGRREVRSYIREDIAVARHCTPHEVFIPKPNPGHPNCGPHGEWVINPSKDYSGRKIY